METVFRDFRSDTLSFNVRSLARVVNSRIASLAAQAQTLHLNSGEVRNLHLNLDEIGDWKVDTDSFRIDTEYLAGSGEHRCTLRKNECRQVLWTPLKEGASLNVKLRQAVKIEVEE